jgi:hypothetical protein
MAGAVSRYSDSTSARRPVLSRNLAAGHHRPPTGTGNDSDMSPSLISILTGPG